MSADSVARKVEADKKTTGIKETQKQQLQTQSCNVSTATRLSAYHDFQQSRLMFQR